MKLSVVNPNVVKYIIRMEKSDPLYHKCLWAEIIFDHDAYSITAISDCGNYAYAWTPTPKDESFQKLCLRMLGDDDYLLRKFSRETDFDLKASKALLMQYNDEDSELGKQIEALTAYDENEWVEALHDYDVSEPWEYIVKDYPTSAKTFVQILKEIVLPRMRQDHQKPDDTGSQGPGNE